MFIPPSYRRLSRRTARRPAETLGWKRVPCVDAAGALRSPEDLHEEIWSLVNEILA